MNRMRSRSLASGGMVSGRMFDTRVLAFQGGARGGHSAAATEGQERNPVTAPDPARSEATRLMTHSS